jgi:prepilin-type processing-associated H-X9-DG protein
LLSLYKAGRFPDATTQNIFSDPGTPDVSAAFTTAGPVGLNHAWFMYGENSRLCINYSTRVSTGVQQTKLRNVLKPTDTVFLAEVDGNSATGPTDISVSVVTGYYAIARHGKLGNFAMCDGSAHSAKTNDFWRCTADANASSSEWAQDRAMYWYPTPATPN